MRGKYSQPLSISCAQQTVAAAVLLARGVLSYFIIVSETRQAEEGGGWGWREA